MIKLLYKTKAFLIIFMMSFNVMASEMSLDRKMAYVVFPPYWFDKPDESGEMGIAHKLMRTIYKHAGLNVEIKATPYARILKHVEGGKVDFVNWAHNEQANQMVHLPIPALDIHQVVMGPNNGEALPTTVEGFANKKVVVVRAWPLLALEPLREQKSTKIYTVGTIAAAIKMLDKGRVDYMIAFKDPLVAYQKEIENFQTVVPMSVKAYSCAIPRGTSNSQELSDRINKAFEELVAAGVIDRETMSVIK